MSITKKSTDSLLHQGQVKGPFIPMTGVNGDGRGSIETPATNFAPFNGKQDEKTTHLYISGLDCADCAAGLGRRIASLPGVTCADINFGAAKMTVRHKGSIFEVIREIENSGYSATEENGYKSLAQLERAWWKNPKTILTIMSGVFLISATIAEHYQAGIFIVISLYAIASFTGAYYAAKSGFYSLRSLSLDMNFLMSTAIIGAMAIGEWSEAGTVAFLFSLGNTLQTYTMDKTRRSIRALMELSPPDALVMRDGSAQRIQVDSIVPGDIMIVKPGERIAMDGKVLSGSSSVNQAAITGESVPVLKNSGDTVYAGTVNELGALEVEVTRLSSDSTLSRIMHLVENAQASKAPSQQFVDIFAKYYTPAVIVAAAAVIIVPWLFFGQSFEPWLYKGLVLLVISCPCALVISTPVSIISAIGNASRIGILIKGGAYLEQVGAIRSLAFDKTGTLTKGYPEITDILPLGGKSESEVLSLAASIEALSEHPLAKAVITRADGLKKMRAHNFQALAGSGARADIEGTTIFIGSIRLFQDMGNMPDEIDRTAREFEIQGKSVIIIGTSEKIFGIMAAADRLRENSKDAVDKLRRAGIKHISMLTGDNSKIAQSIADSLGLDSNFSELLPENKAEIINRMKTEHGGVIMVGDGINDAPALASASTGIAIGSTGSDMALETADIVLMTGDIGKLAYLVRLSRKTLSIIRQNVFFSVIIKLIFLVMTFTGSANLWLAVAADTGASLIVTMNGMRLMRRIKGTSKMILIPVRIQDGSKTATKVPPVNKME